MQRLWPIISRRILNKLNTASPHRKMSCWYRHVDITFIMWQHGIDQLRGFKHLNYTYTNIKFRMELETRHNLSLLGVLVTRKPDGVLGHTIRGNPTHTDLFRQTKSHHDPSQKNMKYCLHSFSVPDCMWHRTSEWRYPTWEEHSDRTGTTPQISTELCMRNVSEKHKRGERLGWLFYLSTEYIMQDLQDAEEFNIKTVYISAKKNSQNERCLTA